MLGVPDRPMNTAASTIYAAFGHLSSAAAVQATSPCMAL